MKNYDFFFSNCTKFAGSDYLLFFFKISPKINIHNISCVLKYLAVLFWTCNNCQDRTLNFLSSFYGSLAFAKTKIKRRRPTFKNQESGHDLH